MGLKWYLSLLNFERKKMFKYILIILISSFMNIYPTSSAETIQLNINGLVCDFCARSLEKVLLKNVAIDSIKVDMNEKKIIIQKSLIYL